MNTIKVLNLRVMLNSKNEPVSYYAMHCEPVSSCDNYFDLLSSSCKAHDIDYAKLLELIIELADLDLFEEACEPIYADRYADDAYDSYKDDKLLSEVTR